MEKETEAHVSMLTKGSGGISPLSNLSPPLYILTWLGITGEVCETRRNSFVRGSCQSQDSPASLDDSKSGEESFSGNDLQKAVR